MSGETFSEEDFRTILPKRLPNLLLMQAALGMGPLCYLIIIMFLFSHGGAKSLNPQAEVLLQTLSWVHAGFAVIGYCVAVLLPGRIFALTLTSNQPKLVDLKPAEKFFSAIQTSRLVRLAILEGIAFFGLTICLLGVQNGILQVQPAYWLNLGSTVVLLAFVFYSFPTVDRILGIYQERIGGTSPSVVR